MNRSGWRPRLAVLGTALIACIYLLSLSSLPALATVGSITEFSPASLPRGITAGPDGNVWFTELDGNRIGRITTTGSFTEFKIPSTCGYPDGCGPIGITSGPDGNLWFTAFDGNSIWRLTPSGSFTGAFHTPTKTSRPYSITVGPDGNLWFTEYIGNKIGRLSMH